MGSRTTSRASAAVRLLIVSPSGEVLRVIAEQPAKRGNDVYLTIDVDIQQRRNRHSATDKPGSIVVMDPRDNTILALATYPRVDPNEFAGGHLRRRVAEDLERQPIPNAGQAGARLVPHRFDLQDHSRTPRRSRSWATDAYQMTPCPGA